jgi:hypothetical protein
VTALLLSRVACWLTQLVVIRINVAVKGTGRFFFSGRNTGLRIVVFQKYSRTDLDLLQTVFFI